MKWINRLTDCVDYIEENLTGEIDVDVLCEKACLSRLYFFRMFEAVTGFSLRDYERNRKMTLAAKELQLSNAKVIDVAFKYGYSSSEAFSRAFKNVHGISPSQAKQKGSKLKSHGKLNFNISITGDEEIKYAIVKKKSFEVLGTSIVTTDVDGENNREIPQFWLDVREDGRWGQLCELGGFSEFAYGICFDDDRSTKHFKYMAGVPYNNKSSDAFELLTIPAATWAVFDCVGPMPDAMQVVWEKIFRDWLPATGFEIASIPQIEYYYPGDPWSDDYRSEIWIPVLET